MLEASIEDKAQAVEGVVEEVASVRKQTRSLEKKLSKLHVKRTKRGSSREALEDLQVRLMCCHFATLRLACSAFILISPSCGFWS